MKKFRDKNRIYYQLLKINVFIQVYKLKKK